MAEAAAKRSRQGEDALRPPDGMASTYRLNDGREMPRLGFGVYRVPKGERCYRAVSAALAEGYRLVDTARLYGNEADVGRAVRESGVPREAVFVTTKVQDSDHGFREALAAGRRSARTTQARQTRPRRERGLGRAAAEPRCLRTRLSRPGPSPRAI
uniref:NADP-dependent oxidoreductase domain-containing protein n=1 Tax=Alexandrium monilatum TaxID=311494 RepID=A0A7S4WA77_9DINO